MKTQPTTVRILKKDTRKGTTNGRDWAIDQYDVVEELEREDGSIVETRVQATTSGSVGELEIGAEYEATIFITSRKSEKDGKTTYWPSFRITHAVKTKDAPSAATAETTAESVDDSIPFNVVP